MRLWEKSYPAGARWDAPIAMSGLPVLFDAFTQTWSAKPALEYRGHETTFPKLSTSTPPLPWPLLLPHPG